MNRIKNTLRAISSVAVLRTLYVFVSLVLQLAILMIAFWVLGQNFFWFYVVTNLAALVLVMRIVNKEINPAYQIAWIIAILFMPLFGVLIYFLFGSNTISKKAQKNIERSAEDTKKALEMYDDSIIERVAETDLDLANQMRYLYRTEGYPAYDASNAEFLTPGEVKFERMKDELRKAKKFIFFEYFIVANGVMWSEILEILIEKAKEGVEVRVMYDDFGSLLTLPNHYGKYLESVGIKHCVFGKLIPVLSVLINHRDHRKILVIDGKVAITGGINIADEYINKKEKHGHWKDASILIRGDAVWSMTVFFLSTWNYINESTEDYLKYKVDCSLTAEQADGIFQPYADSPMDNEQVGENVYLNMINKAKRYVYIESPYLVIDREMMVALCNAAKQGVDVRIMVPAKWDHWYVHAMTRSNYEQLTKSGVRVFEYTPGFIHSKIFISDDNMAVVGTINMDYRSLYLHFENAVLICRSSVLKDIYEDFIETQEKCHEFSYEECRAIPLYKKLGRGLLKVFAPLM